MNCKIVNKPNLRLIGFGRSFGVDNAYQEIPLFWDEVMAKTAGGVRAGNLLGPGEFAVCIDDLGGERFRYLIAGRYDGGPIPEGMEVYEFAAGEWAVFECVGPIPQTFQALNTRVFREWLPDNPEFELSGNATVEWYDDGDPSAPDYHSAIWLPVKRK